ncbi:MAG: TetR/AcrR family transcriptional regulator [Hyphomonadaceae bacterium]
MKPALAPDLRRTVLDASLELIGKQGLSALSMREVARRAGVSHQAPYHHFPDREAILAALVAEGFELLRADMAAAISKAGSGDEKLRGIGRAYVHFAVRHPSHFKLMFRSELVKAEDHKHTHDCAQSAFGLLASVMDEVTMEKFGRPDPTLVVAAWSLAHGLATLLLEGKLDEHFGAGKRAQLAAAERVLDAFGALLRQQPPLTKG